MFCTFINSYTSFTRSSWLDQLARGAAIC